MDPLNRNKVFRPSTNLFKSSSFYNRLAITLLSIGAVVFGALIIHAARHPGGSLNNFFGKFSSVKTGKAFIGVGLTVFVISSIAFCILINYGIRKKRREKLVLKKLQEATKNIDNPQKITPEQGRQIRESLLEGSDNSEKTRELLKSSIKALESKEIDPSSIFSLEDATLLAIRGKKEEARKCIKDFDNLVNLPDYISPEDSFAPYQKAVFVFTILEDVQNLEKTLLKLKITDIQKKDFFLSDRNALFDPVETSSSEIMMHALKLQNEKILDLLKPFAEEKLFNHLVLRSLLYLLKKTPPPLKIIESCFKVWNPTDCFKGEEGQEFSTNNIKRLIRIVVCQIPDFGHESRKTINALFTCLNNHNPLREKSESEQLNLQIELFKCALDEAIKHDKLTVAKYLTQKMNLDYKNSFDEIQKSTSINFSEAPTEDSFTFYRAINHFKLYSSIFSLEKLLEKGGFVLPQKEIRSKFVEFVNQGRIYEKDMNSSEMKNAVKIAVMLTCFRSFESKRQEEPLVWFFQKIVEANKARDLKDKIKSTELKDYIFEYILQIPLPEISFGLKFLTEAISPILLDFDPLSPPMNLDDQMRVKAPDIHELIHLYYESYKNIYEANDKDLKLKFFENYITNVNRLRADHQLPPLD